MKKNRGGEASGGIAKAGGAEKSDYDYTPLLMLLGAPPLSAVLVG
jgi:hypothetical protein